MGEYPISELIKDPKTGKILKLSELYQGNVVEATYEELAQYDMRPQSGTMKLVSGEVVSLVDLILTLATSGGGDGSGLVHWNDILGKPSTFTPSAHEHNDKANILISATKPQDYIGIWCKKEV
ncbi:hypothetical protein [Paraclostridium sordellii]|uniref:hypothetical protein n=1 Tax=Paraclostridium sordellii TaxID=1505 RepID=UPI000C75FC47|nr:hypothetical protein [Paeniclostridium sordellii]AUN14685.1 hypothetical protein RSJ16_10835 [Paeniclostridium sordellii]